MNETALISAFAANTRYRDLPAHVTHQAKRLILDQLGCQVSGAELSWSKAIYRTALRLGRSGPAYVVRYGDRLNEASAAFVNGAFGHANELDDAHIGVRTHPGSVVVPSAMALAPSVQATGEDLVTSIVIGTEVMLRVAATVMPDCMEHNHHHTPPAVGPFGAAAAAGVMMGFDSRMMHNALGIAGSHSGGVMEYTRSGGSVKRIHTGLPAYGGIQSCVLAENGITGPVEILEGERGFCAAFGGDYTVERLSEGLGEDFNLEGIGFKRYSANYRSHAAIEALVDIMTQHDLTFTDISRIRVGVSSATLNSIGTIAEPSDVLGAQFSMRFTLAIAAQRGLLTRWNIDESTITNPELLNLSSRIDVFLDADQERHIYDNLGAFVQVVTHDGRTMERRNEHPTGAPEKPLDDSQIEEKFLELVEPILGSKKAKRAIDSVWELEEMQTTEPLIESVIE